MTGFYLIRIGLWLSLAAASTFAISSGFTVPSLLTVLGVTVALAIWLSYNTTGLRQTYEAREAAVSQPSLREKLLWGDRLKPRQRDLAPGLAIMGLIGFWFAYDIAHGVEPTKLVKLAHNLLGPLGAIGLVCLMSAWLLAQGVESMVSLRRHVAEGVRPR